MFSNVHVCMYSTVSTCVCACECGCGMYSYAYLCMYIYVCASEGEKGKDSWSKREGHLKPFLQENGDQRGQGCNSVADSDKVPVADDNRTAMAGGESSMPSVPGARHSTRNAVVR